MQNGFKKELGTRDVIQCIRRAIDGESTGRRLLWSYWTLKKALDKFSHNELVEGLERSNARDNMSRIISFFRVIRSFFVYIYRAISGEREILL